MKRLVVLTLGLGLAAASLPAATETYAIDPVHSSVGFSIRHFVSQVPGFFTKVSGNITVDRDNLENSSVEATIDANSLDTRNERRDADVKGAGLLDTAKFPTMTFKSKSWKKTGEDTFAVTGDLTLHGVTKEVVLTTKLLGFAEGMRGKQLSGWDVATTLKKSEFGVVGPPMLGKVLGDDVEVHITIEADKS
ncbi:MAG TPA: YceI family protein [Lacunisphaera sp.]|jgi:polyisoprenoid-binding protein YceI|nr:YceI family protein [Lacunisphaera sp.]